MNKRKIIPFYKIAFFDIDCSTTRYSFIIKKDNIFSNTSIRFINIHPTTIISGHIIVHIYIKKLRISVIYVYTPTIISNIVSNNNVV